MSSLFKSSLKTNPADFETIKNYNTPLMVNILVGFWAKDLFVGEGAIKWPEDSHQGGQGILKSYYDIQKEYYNYIK